MTNGYQCTRCKFIKIGDKLACCPQCGAELIPTPESGTPKELAEAILENDLKAGADKILAATETADAKEAKPEPYLMKEFGGIRAARKAYIEKMQAQYGTQKTDWELPAELRWEEARLLATLGWMAEQLAHAVGEAAQAGETVLMMKGFLAVQLKRQGGSVTVREGELNRLHPQFEIQMIDKPELRDAVHGQTLELRVVEPKPGIVIAGAMPAFPKNGRH